MRLIDADTLFPYGGVPFVENDGFQTADKIYCIIKNAPTVDAVKVVHGRWVNNCCSNCNAICTVNVDGKEIVVEMKSDYCPNCGAKMDGGLESAFD